MSFAWCLLVVVLLSTGADPVSAVSGDVPASHAPESWKLYTNARFGFSVRYPQDWRLGEPMSDGLGVTLHPPIPKSQVALSGFLNTVEGTSRDGRQTLEEFAAAHRRIITDLYAKKNTPVRWQKDQPTTLGGQPAKRLSFSYTNTDQTEIVELHVFSVGRNEGRGIRVKVPASNRTALMPAVSRVIDSYDPGRDQNNVSPFAPRSGEAPPGLSR